jgi:precorrin-6Y C5,15-methyltransferase (decarboxylating)
VVTAQTLGHGPQATVLVIGIGDDGPVSLPAAVLARVHQAELLVGGQRHLDLFPDIAAERLTISGGLEHVYQQIEAAGGKRVVVLASGDPCFFGIGPLLAARLGRERVTIIPNVSSVALAFARLGVGWQDAKVVSAHGRPLADAVAAAHGAANLAVLTDDENTPAVVARALLAAGAVDADVWVFEHLGGEREAEHRTTLAGLAALTFQPLNILVVPALSWAPIPTVAPRPAAQRPPLFGRPEAEFHHSAGMITKPEVRAVSLSKLRLRPGGVLWDIGAGSGSLTIEAVALVPDLRVFAIEQTAAQRSLLWQNVGRLAGRAHIKVIDGKAPDALEELPDPDAVFIGGSGGSLGDILDVATRRISHDGRVVINLVILERVTEAVAWARAHSIPAEVVQVGVARGTDIVGYTRLQAENPVTIVTLTGRAL